MDNKNELTQSSEEEPSLTSEDIEDVLEQAETAIMEQKAEEEKYEPEWDGSQSDIILDEDAEEFEEQYSGVRFSYTLTKKEIITTIRQLDNVKRRLRSMTFISVILVLVSIVFLCSYIWFDQNGISLFASIGCIIAPMFQWGTYLFDIKKRTEELDDNIPIELEIFPDEISVTKKYNERTIMLDQTSEFAKIEDLFMIFTPDGKITVIPMRSIEPAFIDDVEAMISSGTIPKGK